MSQTILVDEANARPTDGVEHLQDWRLRSPTASRMLIIGVPVLVMLTCHKTIPTFTSVTVRLLVMTRLVQLLVWMAWSRRPNKPGSPFAQQRVVEQRPKRL